MAKKEKQATQESGGQQAPKPAPVPRLKKRFQEEILPELLESGSYANVMEVPRVTKIVLNIGVGEALLNPKSLDGAVEDLRIITGQQPVVTKARKSIANFKLREGMPVGAKVTLRGARMWEFFDRMVNVAFPRIRDFRGLSPRQFDGRGNYAVGLTEQLVFPEIDYDTIPRVHGMHIAIVTTARNDEEGRELLRLLGMPFRN